MAEARLRIAVLGVSHWHAPRYLAALRAQGEQIAGVSDPDEAVVASYTFVSLTALIASAAVVIVAEASACAVRV